MLRELRVMYVDRWVEREERSEDRTEGEGCVGKEGGFEEPTAVGDA